MPPAYTFNPSSFADLEFSSFHRSPRQALAFFPNGYGASVLVDHGRQGRWELAVIVGDDEREFDLVFDTPITDGVLVGLTDDGVTEVLRQIAALPPRKGSE